MAYHLSDAAAEVQHPLTVPAPVVREHRFDQRPPARPNFVIGTGGCLVTQESGSLRSELVVLRRDRGGTALVVVTGTLTPENLPMVAGLRRRFDRVVVLSLSAERAPAPAHPGMTVVTAATADELARTWNTRIAR